MFRRRKQPVDDVTVTAAGGVRGSGRRLWLDQLLQDLRYSCRTLRQNPLFAVSAVLTLALGIGANTATFSLINSVLLQPLSVRDPARLYLLQTAGAKGIAVAPPYPCFERFRTQSTLLAGAAAYGGGHFKIRIDGRPEQVDGSRVSGEYFTVLGLNPVIGRLLTPADEALSPPAAVIGYAYWQRRFGGRADVIGKTLVMAVGSDKQTTDRTFTIVGVAPSSFDGLQPGRVDDLIIPITTLTTMVRDTGSPWFESIARLKAGVRPEQARAEIDAIFQAFLNEYPQRAEARRDSFHHMELTPAWRGLDDLRKRFSRPLTALMTVVVLVLLIACANITNLLLARAAKREREFAIRVAIGAGRGRLVRQLFVETAMLFVTGAVVGLGLAWFAVRAGTAVLASGPHPVQLDVRWDWRVLSFTAGVALLTTLLFGATPVLRAMRADPNTAMRRGGKASASPDHLLMGRLLVVVQIALSLIVLVGAALFLRTLGNLHAVDLGFRADQVSLVSAELMEASYRDEAPRIAAWDRMLEDVRQLAGVRSASLSAMTPLDGGGRRVGFSRPGFVAHVDEDRFVSLNTVSEDYFATLGTPVLRGRAFTASDTRGAPHVAVLNESAARHFFADHDPIGSIVNINDRRYRVVGVVQDVRHTDIRQRPERFVHISLRQPYDRNFRMTLAVRATLPPQSLIGTVQARLRGGGFDAVIGSGQTLVEQRDENLLAERLIAALAIVFGAVALALSAVGLYGVLAYAVTRRTAEIAIRMALGAQRGQVARNILGQTITLVAIGVAVGVPGSVLFARAAGSLLYGVPPTDVPTQIGAAALLTAVASAASYLPAHRASRVDALTALKCE